MWSSLARGQILEKLIHGGLGRCPAGDEADAGVVCVDDPFLLKLVAHLLQLAGHCVGQHRELLVGGRGDGELVPQGRHAVPEADGHVVGVAGDFKVEPVLQQGLELEGHGPPLGQNGAPLLHVPAEALQWLFQHQGLPEEGAVLGAADVEGVRQGGQVRQRQVIARGGEGESGEELQIPYLSQDTGMGFPIVTGFAVDGAGNYWLQIPYQAAAAVIDKETLEMLEEIATVQNFSMMNRLIFSGNGTVAVNTEDNIYTVYEENRQPQGTLSVKKKGQACMCSDDEHWYIISEEGITRLTVGNDAQEVIMDGGLGAMGSTVNTVMGAVRGHEDDFYVLYYQEKAGTYSLKRYVFDPEAIAVPEHTLQVFGLSDSHTVREAAIGFQKSRPDVKVEFITSGKQYGEITSDDIRTLNTELLGGKGADVLLLDGLPMDAYMEKGILADLSETAEAIMESDAYLEDILKNTASKEGKIYGIPIKFTAPILFGNEDVKRRWPHWTA